MNGLNINIRKFLRGLNGSKEAIGIGIEQSFEDILAVWKDDAKEMAPYKTGKLKRSIRTKLTKKGFDSESLIRANANNKGFNYAFYLHEHYPNESFPASDKVPKFIKKSKDKNEEDWINHVKYSIQKELKRGGW